MAVLHLASLTRRHVREAVSAGLTTAVVPLGATEQHGEALPFGTDTLIANQIAADLAERLGCLLLPAVPYGVSLEHLATAGTVSLSAGTYTRIVREICESLIANGIDRIILLVAHFGNRAPAEIAAEEVVSQTGAIVCVSSYFAGMEAVTQAILGVEEDRLDWAFFNSHGGAAEAALVMASNAGLFRSEWAESASPARSNIFYDEAMKYPHTVEQATPTGQWGDPRRISPRIDREVTGELGQLLVTACGARLAQKFRSLVEEVELSRREAERTQ
jgi:creatinine amidohydrolase/Fe(II)-dependent formamide hydrolase-like protein